MSIAALTALQQQPNAGGDRPPRKRRKWYPRYKFDRRSRIGRRSDALFKSFTAQLGSDVPPELAVKIVSACELTALAESYRAAFVRCEATVPLDDLASFVPAFNANGPVNAIPYVCGARPGMLTTEDLPHILPRGPRPVEQA